LKLNKKPFPEGARHFVVEIKSVNLLQT
jgi:hypothetical protein